MSGVSLLLKNGRVLRAGAKQPELLDLAIGSNGRIAALAPTITPSEVEKVIDLGGQLVVPGLVDAHQHLDKSRTRRLVENPSATLKGASAGYRALAAVATREEIMARAERTLDICLAHGTVAIRSHTNIESDTGLRGLESLIELRERCRDRITLQVVAHLTTDAPRNLDASRQWLEQAIAAGADVIGGVPQNADEPLAFLDLLFEFAVRSGLPLDMHIDEHLDSGRLLFDAVIERTRAHGTQGRVTAGHCCALSAAMPEEATRVRELLDAGVPVAAASDNIQDPFIPIGSGDLLEIARWTIVAGHLGLTDLRTAFDMVSATPAAIIGLGNDWGIRSGARADLLITDADDADDLVATGAKNRAVLVGGRLVAGEL